MPFREEFLVSAIGETMETKLFIDSFNRAKATRQKAVLPTTIFHSDHGSQYLSDQFREVIRISKVTQSMGAIGDSYDNAMAESLWASLKKELVYKRAFKTREEAKAQIFDWINWYNNRRRHSGIGYVSPICYEQAMIRQAA